MDAHPRNYSIKKVSVTVVEEDGTEHTDEIDGELYCGPELMNRIREGHNPATLALDLLDRGAHQLQNQRRELLQHEIQS